MGVLKSDKLEEANRTLLAAYETYATTIPSRVEPLVTSETSPTEAYSFPFFTGIPRARAWLGERLHKDGAIKEINGKTQAYEVTMHARIPDINSGIIGRYVGQMKSLGSTTALFKDKLVADLLNNGTSTSMTIDGYTKSIANYDGGACFATHTLADGSTQSNNVTSTSLTYANLLAQWSAMQSHKNDLSQNLGLEVTHLIVPSALQATAMVLLNNELVNDGSNVQVTNLMKGRLTLVVLPDLSSDTTWFLAGSKAGVTPFAYIEFEAPSVVVVDGEQSEPVFMRNEVDYGWKANADVCFGPWQLLRRCIA